MPVNTTHPDYETMCPAWARARDVLSGEDAIKAAGEKYLPKLDAQDDEDFLSYLARASFFNATARTLSGYIGLIFRKPPYLRLPENNSALGKAMAEFNNDADMLGTSLYGYAKQVVNEIISVGRCGTLIDWENDVENRAYAALYRAEQILNWRVERVNGRNITTLVVLHEPEGGDRIGADFFDSTAGEQIRVLRLDQTDDLRCVVDIWRPKKTKSSQVQAESTNGKTEWQLVETRVPLRLGRPLPLIPFVFHGPENSRPVVPRVPMEDLIALNLSHYRMDADYKHGLHFTALPTAWVSGFEKDAVLRIGSSIAWATATVGATAGFLEYTGQGLTSFERSLDHAERLMSVLGSRMLEGQKKTAETAEAMQIRQSGEDSILGSIATSISESLTQVLRWAYWWNSTEVVPDDVTDQQALLDLNTDFRTKGMASTEITALVAAWQAGAISQDSMFELFRRSEILPDGRNNEEESKLIGKGQKQLPSASGTDNAAQLQRVGGEQTVVK